MFLIFLFGRKFLFCVSIGWCIIVCVVLFMIFCCNVVIWVRCIGVVFFVSCVRSVIRFVDVEVLLLWDFCVVIEVECFMCVV